MKKEGVNARFSPLREQPAWPVTQPGEADLPEIWPNPLPLIVNYLTVNHSLEAARRNLPDVELIS